MADTKVVNVSRWIRLAVPYLGYVGRRYEYRRRRYVHMIHLRTGKHRITSYARYLMSKHLGRLLLHSEIVDHIDGDSLNDRICNLQILSGAENARKYVRELKGFIVYETPQRCDICSRVFFAHKRKRTCSFECKNALLSMQNKGKGNVKSVATVARIKRMRKRGATSYEIADALGISRNTVMKYW